MVTTEDLQETIRRLESMLGNMEIDKIITLTKAAIIMLEFAVKSQEETGWDFSAKSENS